MGPIDPRERGSVASVAGIAAGASYRPVARGLGPDDVRCRPRAVRRWRPEPVDIVPASPSGFLGILTLIRGTSRCLTGREAAEIKPDRAE